MTTTLVPASIIGKVFFVDPHLMDKIVSCLATPHKVALTEGYNYWECRINHYRPETGEILLRLDTCTNNSKWFKMWQEINQDWVKELQIKYIFIE